MHGRTVKQRYKDKADWRIISELKRRFSQKTIIGSGDLFSAEGIVNAIKHSGVDGAAIARGAVGNPWIFRDLRAVIEGKALPPTPCLTEQAEVILKHFEMLCKLYEIKKAIGHFRKFLIHYCKLHPQRKRAQKSLLAADSKLQLLAAIKQLYGEI